MEKHASALLLAAALFLPLHAQAQPLKWPMAGKSAGENILCQPQGYIGTEQNFGSLFVGGDKGDAVICPADGIIVNAGLSYFVRLDYVVGSNLDAGSCFDEAIPDADLGQGIDTKYAGGTVEIRIPDGRRISLHGLTGDRRFKTGQKIAAGDTLGFLAYSYKGFRTPSLMIDISTPQGKVSDPMEPFGLKSTFVEPTSLTRENPMPAEKIREDLDVLKEAVCELYPSLEDKIPEAEFRAFVDSLKASVAGPMDPGDDFRYLLRQVLKKIPDSHVSLQQDPIPDKREYLSPGVFLSYCDDTLRVLLASSPQYEKYIGKVVTSVNGEPAASYAARAVAAIDGYDGRVESMVREESVMLGRYGAMINWSLGATAFDLEFADGTTATVPFSLKNRYPATDTYRRIYFWRMTNMRRSEAEAPYEMRELNDSTAYLGVKEFVMLDTQVDEIRRFLGSCTKPNLIVDVRNNPGGDVEVLSRLLACLADGPMDRQKGGYEQVTRPGPYASFKYSLNRPEEDNPFPEFVEEGGRWISRDTLNTCSVIRPDPDFHYGGKVYVLTNAYSISAATLFPAVLVRNRRGVAVGRETGTTYHSMTALKFVDIGLPNTRQAVTLPLVKEVFDETVCERLPEGRGLLPDYPLPLTFNEVTRGADGQTDVLLEYALSLIADGKYLSAEDPFAEFDKAPAPAGNSRRLLFALGAAILLVIAALLLGKKRK